MSGSRPRLLISASDQAAADAIRPIVHAARRHGIEHRVVAGEPAHGRLRKASIEADLFEHCRIADPQTREARNLVSAASRLIAKYQPDAVLVGLSGPDAGLDEALLMAADGQLPTYAVQDFWGDVNTVMPARPGVFFVVDDYAAELTGRRVRSDIHVVGALRYVDYGEFAPDQMRTRARSQLGLANGRMLIGIFTQALWHIDGYGAQWKTLIALLAGIDCPPTALVRRHPRDTEEQALTIRNMLGSAGIASVDASGLTIEQAICACDVVCSAFSSVATDLCYLQRYAQRPLGTPLLLLFASDLRRHFEGQCGFATHPFVNAGLMLEAAAGNELRDCLARAVDPAVRDQIWRRCRDLPEPATAAERVIERLQADWAARAA